MSAERGEQEDGSEARAEGASPAGEGPEQAPKDAKSRRDRLVKGCFLAAVLIGGVIVYIFQTEGPKFEGWGEDLSAALAQANSEQRPVLVYFVRDSSSTEVRRTARILRKGHNPRAIREGKFVKVKVETTTGSELAKRYELSTLPVMAVLSSEGRVCKLSDPGLGQESFRLKFLEPDFEGWQSNPESDLDEVLQEARRAGRPLLAIFMRIPSTGEARRMGFTTLASQAARDAMDKGRFVKFAARVRDAEHLLAKEHKIENFPTLLIITPDRREFRREGYLGLEEFREFLDSAASSRRSAG